MKIWRPGDVFLKLETLDNPGELAALPKYVTYYANLDTSRLRIIYITYLADKIRYYLVTAHPDQCSIISSHMN